MQDVPYPGPVPSAGLAAGFAVAAGVTAAATAIGTDTDTVAGIAETAGGVAVHKPQRTLLLVDDEANILSALRRLLRADGYHVLSAHNGAEGLAMLEQHAVDVIVSDQRMPGMTGAEFLSIAKTRYPETIRIVLSGYTELQSVTDAVNEGAIYKFLTKPWDDRRLRGHIAEAFQRKEMSEENRRLTREVEAVNHELAAANRKLEEMVAEKQQQITRDANTLAIIREVLQQVPLPVLAVDDAGMIVFVNDVAASLLRTRGSLLGGDAGTLLPDIMRNVEILSSLEKCRQHADALVSIAGRQFRQAVHQMGSASRSHGQLITLMPADMPPYPQ